MIQIIRFYELSQQDNKLCLLIIIKKLVISILQLLFCYVECVYKRTYIMTYRINEQSDCTLEFLGEPSDVSTLSTLFFGERLELPMTTYRSTTINHSQLFLIKSVCPFDTSESIVHRN